MNTEWNLKTFYEGVNDPRLAEDVNTYVIDVETFILKYKGRISLLSNDQFLDYLRDMSSSNVLSEKIHMYLSLAMSLDTQDQSLQKLAKKLQKIHSDCEERLVFIQEEHKLMGAARFMELSQKKEFEPYRNFLVQQAASLKRMLSEAEETLLIKVDQASEENLYEEVTSIYEFPFKGKMLTSDEVRAKRESPDREGRQEAVRSIASVYNSQERQIVLGNLYSLVCKDNVLAKGLRGYDGVMSIRNESEEVSDEAVDTLLSEVTKMYPYFHEYLRLKQRMIGLEKMEYCDILAPVGQALEKKVTFEEGWRMFMDVIKKVDPRQHAFMEGMLEGGRISVYPRKGKSTGAYAAYYANTDEFMMLNWADSMNDVTTLAHEAGHCMHGHLSKAQDPLVYHTPLTLAETASIFNETLMFEALLEQAAPEQRKAMVMGRLDDIFFTIFRQIAYVKFERRCHESFERNEPMTYEDYNEAWLEEFSSLFGPDMELKKEEIGAIWSSIPHIFQTPFYCYTYAFGNIISLNIVQQYKEAQDKELFMEKYHSFLAAGGSERPEDLLMKTFGIRMDEHFYRTALQSIVELMNMIKEKAIV